MHVPYLSSSKRQTQIHAAQLCQILRDLDRLQDYTGRDLTKALEIHQQRHGSNLVLSEGLEKAVAKRAGQMRAVQLLATPMMSNGPEAADLARERGQAAKAEAKAKEQRKAEPS